MTENPTEAEDGDILTCWPSNMPSPGAWKPRKRLMQEKRVGGGIQLSSKGIGDDAGKTYTAHSNHVSCTDNGKYCTALLSRKTDSLSNSFTFLSSLLPYYTSPVWPPLL